ncbi:MAG: flagellar hook-length control protein FliK [Variovorax sp.]|nr:flagellar hook-length control protein FliK [Variovorax sp.]
MVGLSGLIDTLLTAKNPPRMDVLAIKSEAEIGPPGPVPQVGKAVNDVRLPSNAALERLLPGGTGELAQREGGATNSAKAELSATARLISALLSDVHGDAPPVRGAAPAWALAQSPNAGALASSLSRVVAGSGLFYESHLAEFAAGSRTLAQMAQEPQARWSGPALAAALAAESMSTAAADDAKPQPASTTATAPQQAGAQGAATVIDAATQAFESAAMPKPAAPEPAQRSSAHAAPAGGNAPAAPVDAPPPGTDAELHPESARLQAAYRWGEAARPVHAEAMADRPGAEAAAARPAATASAARTPPVAQPDAIHPQAVTLIHQQLDLLATAVFRWNGEAWPGVPMQWSIEHDDAQREARAGADEEALRAWSTTVSMKLPRLGAVDVRLSLNGESVRARLSATLPETVACLRAEGGAFAERLSAIGLSLHDFDVSGKEPA